jgi:ATP-binding cassette subfamily F protein 3
MTSSKVELVILNDIQLRRGGQVILDDVQLTLRSGERLGLIGANGAGKSTVQMLVLGTLNPSAGSIWRAPGLSLGGLPDLERSLKQLVTAKLKTFESQVAKSCLEHNGEHQPVTVAQLAQTALVDVHALEASLRAAERKLSELAAAGNSLTDALDTYTRLREQFEHVGGYTAASQLEAHLSRFGLASKQAAHKLSTGERARLALAMALSRPADVLVLDEPERHLDIAHRQYLADILKQHPATLLLSSHDRTLLDKVCSHIGYLHEAKLTRYRGNYSAFVRQHDSDKTRLLRAAKLRRRKQVGLEQAVSNAPNVSARRRAQRRLQRFLMVEEDQQGADFQDGSQYAQRLRLHLGTADALTSTTNALTSTTNAALVRVQHLSVGILKDVNFQLEVGVTVALTGANGTGKTTLLEAIAGKLEPAHPHARIHWSRSAKLAYYDSQYAGLRADVSVFVQLTQYVSNLRARALLGLVGLADHVHKQPAELSSGQRARAGLALVMASEANVILLDEPSEYLDIDMVNVLEQAITDSPAAILMVSHDAALIEAVSDRVWSLEDGQLRVYPNLKALHAGHSHPNLAERASSVDTGMVDTGMVDTGMVDTGMEDLQTSDADDCQNYIPDLLPDKSLIQERQLDEASLEQHLAKLDERLLDPTCLSERDYQRLRKRHAEVIDALSTCYNQRQPAPQAAYSTVEQGIRVMLDSCIEEGMPAEIADGVWCVSSTCGLYGRVHLHGYMAHISLVQPADRCVLSWARRRALWALVRLLFEHVGVRGVQTQSAQPVTGLQAAGAGWWVLNRHRFEVLEGYYSP